MLTHLLKADNFFPHDAPASCSCHPTDTIGTNWTDCNFYLSWNTEFPHFVMHNSRQPSCLSAPQYSFVRIHHSSSAVSSAVEESAACPPDRRGLAAGADPNSAPAAFFNRSQVSTFAAATDNSIQEPSSVQGV